MRKIYLHTKCTNNSYYFIIQRLIWMHLNKVNKHTGGY
ncbi:hypothetical protein TFUB4_01992 [Tannerella forsythia]|uniref:Uncharacterized protein n=1 Tax=Tannerella forsythia TaxID=28112 RepID=A0A1D3UPT5_TANFO|nr:hypothetical protein TFUB4_01992 [Tannerella forsythia]SCQ23377.1 hypothetical protein TFUB20_02026 [Tannerella forsythia]